MNLRFRIPNGDDLEAPIEVWVAGLVSMLSEDDTGKLLRAIRVAQQHTIPVAKSNIVPMKKGNGGVTVTPPAASFDVDETMRFEDPHKVRG